MKTVMRFHLWLISQRDMDAILAESEDERPAPRKPLKIGTYELNWPYPVPGKGDEICLTDLSRTTLSSVDWWPGEEEGCVRVLHTKVIYESYQQGFDEAQAELKRLGAQAL